MAAAPRVAFAGQSIPAYARTVGRAVHVKIYPQPRNLAESTEVLRVLQQYGEIVMYKQLKHETNRQAVNTALAIYQNDHSAQDIINASPLRFESGRVESSSSVSQFMPSTFPSAETEEDRGPAPHDESDHVQEEFKEVNTARQRPNEAPGHGTTFTGLSGTARWGTMRSSFSSDQAATTTTTSPSSPPKPPKTFTPNPTPLKASSADLPNPSLSSPRQTSTTSSSAPREFHLVIERSALNHRAYIQRQHYYAGFKLDLRDAMGDDLEGRVPVVGMADCRLEKEEVPLRIRIKRQEEEDQRDWVSLGSLWEEGEKERAREMEREAGEQVDVNDRVRENALFGVEIMLKMNTDENTAMSKENSSRRNLEE